MYAEDVNYNVNCSINGSMTNYEYHTMCEDQDGCVNESNNEYTPRSNLLAEKSLAFAVRIVNLTKLLRTRNKEHTLAKQVLRSGTSIGAMIHESEYAQSKADFVNKLAVALKETNETSYWLILLHMTGYLNDPEYNSISTDCKELLRLLVASLNTVKGVRKEIRPDIPVS